MELVTTGLALRPLHETAWIGTCIPTRVGVCLAIIRTLDRSAARGTLSDETLNNVMAIYHAAREDALAIPAVTAEDRAALAILALADLPRGAIRRDNDLGGMVMLALAEDLIAAVI